jgi:archaellum component FlaG (FlaF/FlaG flagellin family)
MSRLLFGLVFLLVSLSLVGLLTVAATVLAAAVAATAAAVTKQVHANEKHQDNDEEPIPVHTTSSLAHSHPRDAAR